MSREAHEAVQEGARGGVRVTPLGCELAAGGIVDTNGGLGSGGDGHFARAGEGDAGRPLPFLSVELPVKRPPEMLVTGPERRDGRQPCRTCCRVTSAPALVPSPVPPGAGRVGVVYCRVHGRGRLERSRACALGAGSSGADRSWRSIGDVDSGSPHEVLDDVGLHALIEEKKAGRSERAQASTALTPVTAVAMDACRTCTGSRRRARRSRCCRWSGHQFEAHVRRHAPTS